MQTLCYLWPLPATGSTRLRNTTVRLDGLRNRVTLIDLLTSVNAYRATAIEYTCICTKFGVDSSSRSPVGARTNRHTDATERHTHHAGVGKCHMAYRIAAFPMTFNDLQRYSPIAVIFKCDSSTMCAVFDNISTDTARRAVSLRYLSFLCLQVHT